MRLVRSIILPLAFVLITISAVAQDANVKHFDKDGLSFDYPANWQLTDKSTGQMQFLELMAGDVTIRVRSPRESLKTPDKEAHAKKLFRISMSTISPPSFSSRECNRSARRSQLKWAALTLKESACA